MSDITFSRRAVPATLSMRNAIVEAGTTIGRVARQWLHNYRSRRELATYSRHERADLNFAAEADAELIKPFWEA